MGYVIFGGICLLVGAFMGAMLMALCAVSKNNDVLGEDFRRDIDNADNV